MVVVVVVAMVTRYLPLSVLNRAYHGTESRVSRYYQLQRGDEILFVDGIPVSEEDVVDHIIGSDIVGTFVTVTVRKKNTNSTMDVTLNRMSSEAIADRRRYLLSNRGVVKRRIDLGGEGQSWGSKLRGFKFRESKLGGVQLEGSN
eukprot:2754817-Rhodomonas_salina.1